MGREPRSVDGADRAVTDPVGKVAVVTGGSRGIGRACAEALADDGWAVALGYRTNEAAAKEAREALEAGGARSLAVELDVTDEGSVTEAFRRVSDELGAVTGLVNNAGMSRDGLLVKYPMDVYEATLATNLRGAFLCCQAALRGMLRARWGRIVNMSSAVALRGNPGQTVYAATKTGLVGLTRSLAREVGPRGITVNALCPGFLETEMTSGISDQARANFLEQTPIGRAATLQEVANVVRFVMSEEASYVNGVALPVDGGLTA
jgi:3-oxoacyl-[acyl-carrier protein] reductase